MIDTFYNYSLNIEIFKELSAVNSFILSCYLVSLFCSISPSSVKRTELIKTNSPLPFVKTNITLGHMDYYGVSPCAKVPGGCRLQFEQIARDVQCRKPSSKDDIMRWSWFCCYSNCDRFDLFVTVLIRFEKKTVATVPKHLLRCFNLLRVHFILC